jgi:death on curing protein
MRLISVSDVIELHSQGIARYGGMQSVSKGTSDCVQGRIGNAELAEQYVSEDEQVRPGLCFAGFLLFYLVRDNCFVDGNKRIGWLAAMRVLADAGLTVRASEDEAFAFVDSIARGVITDGRQAVLWLAGRLISPDPDDPPANRALTPL